MKNNWQIKKLNEKQIKKLAGKHLINDAAYIVLPMESENPVRVINDQAEIVGYITIAEAFGL